MRQRRCDAYSTQTAATAQSKIPRRIQAAGAKFAEFGKVHILLANPPFLTGLGWFIRSSQDRGRNHAATWFRFFVPSTFFKIWLPASHFNNKCMFNLWKKIRVAWTREFVQLSEAYQSGA